MAVCLVLGGAILAYAVARLIMPQLGTAGITGRDIHKPARPEIAEMGGLAILCAFVAGVLAASGAVSFLKWFGDADLVLLLASLGSVLIAALVGILDDLLDLPQGVKAVLPLAAAIPLMAVRAGDSVVVIPAFGPVDLWIFYPLAAIPCAMTVAANGVNMLAGFNGLEAGLGLSALGSLTIIAWHLGETTALLLLLPAVGALAGFLPLNWYPAKIFVGDVGTLTIGAIVAAAVIIGDFEVAGLILLTPYVIDFVLKAANRFPTRGWGGELRSDGKLYCPEHGPVGLCQLILKVTGGIHEQTLVLVLVGLESVLGVCAILLYVLN